MWVYSLPRRIIIVWPTKCQSYCEQFIYYNKPRIDTQAQYTLTDFASLILGTALCRWWPTSDHFITHTIAHVDVHVCNIQDNTQTYVYIEWSENVSRVVYVCMLTTFGNVVMDLFRCR